MLGKSFGRRVLLRIRFRFIHAFALPLEEKVDQLPANAEIKKLHRTSPGVHQAFKIHCGLTKQWNLFSFFATLGMITWLSPGFQSGCHQIFIKLSLVFSLMFSPGSPIFHRPFAKCSGDLESGNHTAGFQRSVFIFSFRSCEYLTSALSVLPQAKPKRFLGTKD